MRGQERKESKNLKNQVHACLQQAEIYTDYFFLIIIFY